CAKAGFSLFDYW
nr:immunoglobulin heavy chain junction region [Macaca mulatta]